jgi:uroporphyrinogen-III decarboxylase
MATEPDYVEKLFRIKAEGDLRRLEQLHVAVGDNADIFGVDGADYGTQRSEMFSPELFKRFYLPYYREVNGWVHENTSWKTWKHSCGSIPELMPLLIEGGIDAINPVQTSAAGMEPETLKSNFGDEITFWGGGVDTQRTLPFAKPEEVYAEVSERLKVFGPGGGFVFATVHNIQAKTPPENIDALFQALRDYGAGA